MGYQVSIGEGVQRSQQIADILLIELQVALRIAVAFAQQGLAIGEIFYTRMLGLYRLA